MSIDKQPPWLLRSKHPASVLILVVYFVHEIYFCSQVGTTMSLNYSIMHDIYSWKCLYVALTSYWLCGCYMVLCGSMCVVVVVYKGVVWCNKVCHQNIVWQWWPEI